MSHIFISIDSFDKNEFDKQLNYLLGLGCELKEGSYSEDTMSFNKKYYSQTVLIDTNKYNHFEFNDEEGKWTEWHENGQKKSEGTYKDGEMIEWTLWDEDGNLLK